MPEPHYPVTPRNVGPYRPPVKDKEVNPRDYAVLAVDAMLLPGLPTQAFKRQSCVLPSDPRDRAFAERLVVEVTKNLEYLAALIAHYAQRPYHRIEPRLRLILLVGVAQVEFFDRIPSHALVTEAVQQTRRFKEVGLSRSSGFINAVMRRAVERADLENALPPRSEPAAYCRIVLSHPRPIVSRLLKLLGPDDAIRFCEHDNREPPLLVRLIGNATPEQLLRADTVHPPSTPTSKRSGEAGPDETSSEKQPQEPNANTAPASPLRSDDGFIGRQSGLTVRPHVQSQIAVVEGARAVDIVRWSEEGLAQPQDATSAAVPALLDVQPGMTVLDRCCGVGTKTQQLCEAAGEESRVFAVDSHGARISTLRKLAKGRPIMRNLTAKRAEWSFDFPDDWPVTYQRILVDAPCSNSGVLARRAEARYADTNHDELRDLQGSLLDDVWPLLAPGGRIVYATCSVWPEENVEVIKAFISRTPGVRVVEEHSWLPSFNTEDPTHYRDGGYAAVLEQA